MTKYFYELGWHGVNVEPNRKFPLLAADRPRDVNLNVAVGDQDGEQTFFEFSQNPALSTFIQFEADEHRQRFGYDYVAHRVPVRTLASICNAHGVNEIDFMSIDVEGYERQVLSGADWRRRPRVVLIEATRPHLTETTHAGWESLLFAADYRFSYFDGLNRFYLRSEDAHLAVILTFRQTCSTTTFYTSISPRWNRSARMPAADRRARGGHAAAARSD